MTAFSEDFLETIVGVSWAPIALIFEGSGSGNGKSGAAPARMSIEFPGMAGGTPGFTLNDGFTPNGKLRSQPFTINEKIISTGVTTDAGLNFPGYGAYTTRATPELPSPALCAGIALRLGGEFASKFQVKIALGPFAGLPLQQVRLALAMGVGPGGVVGAQTYRPIFAPNLKIPSIAPAQAQIVADLSFEANYDTVFTFLVDPPNKALSVV